jgi:hypothetical protein
MESVADAAAAASVTPDRAISGADTERRAACAAQASESESSSFDQERCRRSWGGEAALIESVADAAAAASVTPDRAISGADTEQRAAFATQASESESSSLIESVADAAAAASVTPERAISGEDTERRAAYAAQASESVSSSFDWEHCLRSCGGELKLPRARAVALMESVADAAAAASVTSDTAISGADTERRAAYAAQASESESSSFDRERC